MADAVIPKYYTKVTDAGLAAEAQAKVQNKSIKIATMQVGDGNGAEYDPDGSETALKNLKWEGAINALTQDANNPTWWIAEAVLPDAVGGFTMREVALRTDTGVFYAICKYPPSFKPVLAQGSGRQVYVRAIFEVSNDVNVTLLVDPAVVMASQSFVDDALNAHEGAADPHPQYWNDARGSAKLTAHVQAADPHTQYWNDTRGANSLKALGLGTNNALATDDANDRTDLSVFKHFYTSTLNNTLSPQGTAAAAVVLSKITGTAGFNLAAMYNTANTKPIMKFRLGNTSAWGGWRALATLDPSVTDPQVPACFSISSLPTVNIGPIFVLEAEELWTWKRTAYFQGYRSNLCGRPVDGHTASPLPNEIDAIGGLLSKTAYAGLWGYAQENNLVLTQANWTANIGGHYFVDVDANNFRVPDLRNMFRRYTGTDADTANARALGSRQSDALRSHAHNIEVNSSAGSGSRLAVGTGTSGSGSVSTGLLGGAETRPSNTAYAPRLHA